MPVQRDHRRRGDESAFQVPTRIPIFPLPDLVFFPKTYLPLHIFEPRYREMVADAATQGQCIGMVLLKEGWEERYYGRPAIHPVGCVGRLVDLQRLEDGRSNIVLYGLHPYQVVQEHHDKAYREATITLSRQGADRGLDRELVASLTAAAVRYLGARAEETAWRRLFQAGAEDHEMLVQGLSSCLDLTPLEKQFLLEADSIRQQAGRLRDLIQLKAGGPHLEG